MSSNLILSTKFVYFGFLFILIVLSHKPPFWSNRAALRCKKTMKEYAKQFYRSKKWQQCRRSFINSRIMIDGGLCQRCQTAPGYIVHHKIHITPQNINNPDITLNHDNLEFVCHECHNKEHFGEKMRVNFDVEGKVIPPLKSNF